MTEIPDAELDSRVRRLRRLDCCAVSDALDQLNDPGAVSGLLHRAGAGRIAGRVVTVRLGIGEPPPGPKRHLGCTAIEKSGANDVLVIEQRTGIDCGSWGGLLSLAAKRRGIAGVIAEGPVRDVDEALAMDFSIFSRALTARTARGRIVELGTDVPVTVGEAAVRPGDFVIADRSGVAFIRAENIEAVLDAAERIAARESAMAQAILAGSPVGEVMGTPYEHMLKTVK
jgi:4-hydroxy-4-methyl-2-oxoglutarate aldolase